MIYDGDVGTTIHLTVDIDISDATELTIRYQKPNRQYGEWPATLSGTDTLEYVTQADDVDIAGKWKLQAYIELPLWQGSSAVVEMRVGSALAIAV